MSGKSNLFTIWSLIPQPVHRTFNSVPSLLHINLISVMKSGGWLISAGRWLVSTWYRWWNLETLLSLLCDSSGQSRPGYRKTQVLVSICLEIWNADVGVTLCTNHKGKTRFEMNCLNEKSQNLMPIREMLLWPRDALAKLRCCFGPVMQKDTVCWKKQVQNDGVSNENFYFVFANK